MSQNPSSPIITSMETAEMAFSEKVFACFQLFYGIPSFVVMLILFVQLKSCKRYHNSFYRLVQVDLLTNMLTYANTWIALRLEKFQSCIFMLRCVEFYVPSFLTLSKYFSLFFNNMQFLLAAVLNIHRISSILFPMSCEKFWCRYYILVTLAFCIYSYLPRFLWASKFTVEVKIINGTLTKFRYPDVMDQAINVTAVLNVVYFILIIIIGLVTVILVNKMKVVSESNLVVKRKLSKISMTYCSIFAVQLTWTIVNSLNSNFSLFPDIILNVNTYLLTVVSDLVTLALPWILLIHDGNVRKGILGQKMQRRTMVVSLT
ncbi:Serpentine receptor class gamma [Caenorhabditis elegans]|uniref:Serpentine receptor class gamma n=1 Tax=Caenorhabditis elegans TaxID=6239 RepID=Q86B37_CAEEL|nr:Serpentine receptor class gamma [Caenorhabditis elegans]CCD65476.1 Serpentine receptor class gamma [Caenorhabditis elegans]|eukprot:NP_503743.3 Serpentine receptor class gamma [Caenorhabditis elegans]